MIKINIDSEHFYDFNAKQDLNSDIWYDEVLNEDVREALIKITQEFVDFINVDIDWDDIEDIIFTGSLANYNYTKYSDIDLHILLDFEKVDENFDLVKEYLMSKKIIWNDKHDIKIKGYEVEIYPQDINEIHHSAGVYSILNDEWLIKPEIPDSVWSRVNTEDIRKKAEDLSGQIDVLEKEFDLKKIKKFKNKIKKMRQSGLEEGGEYSTENLVFKVLRRNGYLLRMIRAYNNAYDKLFSLNGETN